MRVVHLMASPFFGGPERQVLGLAGHMSAEITSAYLSFAERGRAQTFIDEVQRQGYEGRLLQYNSPRIGASITEVAATLRQMRADVLCCSGYKPTVVGWRAARRAGIPVVAVSHGWTAVTWKVRANEMLERLVLRWVDAVVCVSRGQAARVRSARVPDAKIVVIPNAVGEEAFVAPEAACRAEMEAWFPQPPRWLIGSAGRLSPEKGHGVLIDAAALLCERRPGAGFVLFGAGPLRQQLERQRADRRLEPRFVMAGFRDDLRRYLPNLDMAVMSSYTEGLPVFLLEAAAAGLPAVATAVGGVPEVVEDGRSGYLVPAGDANALADRMMALLDNATERSAMGEGARSRVRAEFSFAAMGQAYEALFRRLTATTG